VEGIKLPSTLIKGGENQKKPTVRNGRCGQIKHFLRKSNR